MRDVIFYFDFLSPYSWLALRQAGEFAAENDVRWDLRPVVLGKLLDASGRLGPGEVEAQRVAMGWDVARKAALLGFPFRGPPAHPFRSLEALRTACLFRKEPDFLELCVAIGDAAWGLGRDLTDPEVLRDVVETHGFDPNALEARVRDPAVKLELAKLTAEAVERGVFGVPTFVWRDELFWGQDRLSDLAARLAGRGEVDADLVRRYLARPRAIDRKGITPPG